MLKFLHLRKRAEKQGITILTSTTQGWKRGGNGNGVSRPGRDNTNITMDRVVLAVEFVGNVENLGVEGTKVNVNAPN